MPRSNWQLAIAMLATWSSCPLWAQDCRPELCNGQPPAILTKALPPLRIGEATVAALEIRGNNAGRYISYTDASPGEGTREIHIDLDSDEPSRHALREAQQHVSVAFGRCSVTGNVTSCYVGLTGRAVGTLKIPIKAFDDCPRGDCPGIVAGKLHFSYSAVALPVTVVP